MAAQVDKTILLTGNVLVQASPGQKTGPSFFYEYDFKTNTFSSSPVPAPPNFSGGSHIGGSSEIGRMLVVSSGHVFYMHYGRPASQMGFYVPNGTYDPAWAPVIESVTGESCCVVRGKTYTVSGTQFNGLSGGAAYGDDAQSATNYPLVQIVNCKSRKKYFARTHGFSTMGVATGPLNVVTAKFDVSPSTETGPSNLIVIANGIPSQPFGGADQTCGSFINVQ